MFDLTDRVVMVAGASGNLGQAIARAFHEAGANLVLLDRAPDRLPELFPNWPQNRESMPKVDHGSWVPPEAIADVILFLASDAARVVNGAAVPPSYARQG